MDGHPVIRTVPLTGGESTLLIGPGGDLRDAENGSLSPDGSLVTFLGSEFGRPGPQRWVANATGTERRLLPEVYGIPRPVSLITSFKDTSGKGQFQGTLGLFARDGDGRSSSGR